MPWEVKLVRDRIPLPGECTIKVEGEVYEALLRLKLLEEAVEYALTGDPEELADVLEVVRALAELHGLELDDIERLAGEKRRRLGSFRGGRVLLSLCRQGRS